MTEDEQKYQILKANYEKLQRKANMNSCEEKRLAAKIDYYERRIASGELVERKNGHWVDAYEEESGHYKAKCSICGKQVWFAVSKDLWGKRSQYDFCPRCGAKMVEPQE